MSTSWCYARDVVGLSTLTLARLSKNMNATMFHRLFKYCFFHIWFWIITFSLSFLLFFLSHTFSRFMPIFCRFFFKFCRSSPYVSRFHPIFCSFFSHTCNPAAWFCAKFGALPSRLGSKCERVLLVLSDGGLLKRWRLRKFSELPKEKPGIYGWMWDDVGFFSPNSLHL